MYNYFALNTVPVKHDSDKVASLKIQSRKNPNIPYYIPLLNNYIPTCVLSVSRLTGEKFILKK